MQDFEKLGVFYLGREYDLAAGAPREDLLLYDSKDLVTHAVCVGMTGSGKTGLCITLLEEAALDGIPALIIDPKGDITNLMLAFPELRPEDFRPWINEDDAVRKGLTAEDYAAVQADLWRKGLADWGQLPERIAHLTAAAEFAIYTPGSNAGLPLSILKSFSAPPPQIADDEELLHDRIDTTVTSLLALLGIKADPLQSREHILLSTILNSAWTSGEALDLAALIQQVQRPPFERVGVLDLESFYPGKERFGLAMLLNNLLASPGFRVWMEGEPLDVASLLYTPAGRPRHAIISIAHLGDTERMFFVSLLLNEVLGWMRAQPGTSSLRALVYMDEIFGFFPPVAEPPSKKPLLTLLKQARAFGLGLVLTTQNPADLDYKGLGNAGTWFIGRLQTERDKARVMEGLEGVAAGASGEFDKAAMEQTLAGLGNRVFLMYNVHEDAPVVFQTRWAMSYLRGPLTREQIKTIMDPRRSAAAAGIPSGATEATTNTPAASGASPGMPSPPPAREAGAAPPAGSATTARPLLPPGIEERFLPLRGGRPGGADLEYRPAVLGAGEVHLVNDKLGVNLTREVLALAPLDQTAAVDWNAAELLDLPPADLDEVPSEGARFAPPSALKPKDTTAWRRDLTGWLYRTQTVSLLKSTALALTSRPEETEAEFRVRVGMAAREHRDDRKIKLQKKYAARLATLDDRIRKAQQAVQREAEQAQGQGVQTVISVGATLLSAFMGRKKISTSTLGRATTAARGVGRAMDQRGDVARAQENMAVLQAERAALEAEFAAELEALEVRVDPFAEWETVVLRPRKSDVTAGLVALAWVPYWIMGEEASPAYGE